MNLDIDQADFASIGQERVAKIFAGTPLTYLTGNASDPVLSAQLHAAARNLAVADLGDVRRDRRRVLPGDLAFGRGRRSRRGALAARSRLRRQPSRQLGQAEQAAIVGLEETVEQET